MTVASLTQLPTPESSHFISFACSLEVRCAGLPHVRRSCLSFHRRSPEHEKLVTYQRAHCLCVSMPSSGRADNLVLQHVRFDRIFFLEGRYSTAAEGPLAPLGSLQPIQLLFLHWAHHGALSLLGLEILHYVTLLMPLYMQGWGEG